MRGIASAIPPRYRGEVATRYRYRDDSGEIGLIASVTRPFCADCTRARISAEGRFYTCLFTGEPETVPKIIGVAIGADSDNTKSHSVGYVSGIELEE